MNKPKIIVFASGTKHGGGAGFENLVRTSYVQGEPVFYEVVAVVSQYPKGGVARKARILGIPFFHLSEPFSATSYRKIVKDTGAEWVALSGWSRKVEGLDPKKTFNIHPGPLPEFGGSGMYGMYLHEAVLQACKEGKRDTTEVNMHFVTDEYDRGPVFFKRSIPIQPTDSVQDIADRVHKVEKSIQPQVTSMVVNGQIRWDGKDFDSVSLGL